MGQLLQLPGASCLSSSHDADGELRNHPWGQVVSPSESPGTGQCTVSYTSGLFSHLHGEMTRVWGCSAADTPASKVPVVLLCSLGFSCLETPVELEYRQEAGR